MIIINYVKIMVNCVCFYIYLFIYLTIYVPVYITIKRHLQSFL